MGDGDEGLSIGEKVKLLRDARNFRGTQPLAQLTTNTLRKLAATTQMVEIPGGDRIIGMGERADAMFVLLSGACEVTFNDGIKGEPMQPGSIFGELAVVAGCGRTATVTADGPVQLLRMESGAVSGGVSETVRDAIGKRGVLERRRRLLARVSIFRQLGREELLQLGMLMDEVTFGDNTTIVQQGKLGDCLYVLEEGNLNVYVRQRGGDQGLVATLEPGEYFGELAIVAAASRRTATVKATSGTRCLRLRQRDVRWLLTSTKYAPLIAATTDVYDKRQRLRASEKVKAPIEKIWQLMVSESNRISEAAPGGQSSVARWQRLRRAGLGGAITRDGYTSMHLRIAKVVTKPFSLEEAKQIAAADWVEDISAFSGDSKVNIWLEAVKTRLREESRVTVMKSGWKMLFDKYDTDGGGTIGVDEFRVALRDDMKISGEEISDANLLALFAAADDDGSGELDAGEFAGWMVEPQTLSGEEKYGKQIHEHKALVQAASTEAVSKLGWRQLFASYDEDAGGELDFREFLAIIRTDCKINAKTLAKDDVRRLFDAVDSDDSGAVDTEEFIEFCCSDPLACDMTFEIFAESMFQFARLWVSKPSEDMYAQFLEAIFNGISRSGANTFSAKATTTGSLKDIKGSNDKNHRLKDIEGSNDKNHRFKDLEDISCLVKENGCLNIEGVQTNSVCGDGKPDLTFDDTTTAKKKKFRYKKPDGLTTKSRHRQLSVPSGWDAQWHLDPGVRRSVVRAMPGDEARRTPKPVTLRIDGGRKSTPKPVALRMQRRKRGRSAPARNDKKVEGGRPRSAWSDDANHKCEHHVQSNARSVVATCAASRGPSACSDVSEVKEPRGCESPRVRRLKPLDPLIFADAYNQSTWCNLLSSYASPVPAVSLHRSLYRERASPSPPTSSCSYRSAENTSRGVNGQESHATTAVSQQAVAGVGTFGGAVVLHPSPPRSRPGASVAAARWYADYQGTRSVLS